MVDTLIELGGPCAIFFKTLGERTVALAQLEKRRDPTRGYEPMLERLLEPILVRCAQHGIPIISNFGAANPAGAARPIVDALKAGAQVVVTGRTGNLDGHGKSNSYILLGMAVSVPRKFV